MDNWLSNEDSEEIGPPFSTSPISNENVKEEEDSKQDSKESSIEKLDEDCLIYIFSYLPVADRVRVERVCKSWQVSAQQSWTGLKKLNFTPKELGLRSVGTKHEVKEINEEVVEKILKRCGRYLEEINDFKSCTTFLISKYCKNVQTIKLSNFSKKLIKELARNCTNISNFKIEGVCFDLNKINKRQRQLQL